LCLGPSADIALAQAVQALGAGCGAVMFAPGLGDAVAALQEAGVPVAPMDGLIESGGLAGLERIGGVAAAGRSAWARELKIALASREGAILPLISDVISPTAYWAERLVCVDTTAAGGNARLLASS
ncbi:MAG: bifunctional proline dehydrogenase/L-glutamate gamma-semialdehyde dehydrogenase, partial [Pseudomonadota bacterium]